MFDRVFTSHLVNWYHNEARKPLIVRGARQVGKTTTIKSFAEKYGMVYLNLERAADRNIFRSVTSAQESIRDIEIATKHKITPGKTVLFIDEIQESQLAMSQLRFYYEEQPDLHVVAAGSLLELKLKESSIEVPVGRIQYGYMSGVTFDEYLRAIGNEQAHDYLAELTMFDTISESIHETMLNTFRDYALIGGMPEIVANYVSNHSYESLHEIYDSILTSFSDDIRKYSKGAKSDHLTYLLNACPKYAGTTVTFNKFDNSDLNSKQVSAAFTTLQLARLTTLVRPSNSIELPVAENLKAKPKLLFFDTGLVNYAAGLVSSYIETSDLSAIHRGAIAEQVAGLSLWQQTEGVQNALNFWTKFKAGASAEIDFLLTHKGRLVPIEVKSGSVGRLRSLHQFIDVSEFRFAVKISSQPLHIEQVKSLQGTSFTLLNIPHYLTYRLLDLIDF